MDQAHEQDRAQPPLLRVTTFGEFALERLVPSFPSTLTPPRYSALPREDVNSRGTALIIFKILLCRNDRRASKEELMAAIWDSDEGSITARHTHTFDTAASLLRRHILRSYDGESLLITLRSRGETSFKLPPQSYLWVDADAFLTLASRATELEQQGADPLPYLEQAHSLARGEFLDEDLHYKWSQGRRLIINGARRRVLYKLVELYVRLRRVNQAEELLFAFLADNPTDEDALCQLMLLLAEKERRREALNIYQYVAGALRDEKREPASYTKSLVHQIQQGPSLREGRATYTTLNIDHLLVIPLAIPKSWRSSLLALVAAVILCSTSRVATILSPRQKWCFLERGRRLQRAQTGFQPEGSLPICLEVCLSPPTGLNEPASGQMGRLPSGWKPVCAR